ncbi:MAG TPA: GAF domain-containing protein [Chloroflexota bacterium]|nr:GAF domain-containing protein [Chloroflexota bacterium]
MSSRQEEPGSGTPSPEHGRPAPEPASPPTPLDPVDVSFAEQLRQALIRMAAAGQLTAPVAHTDVLDLIVGTAAQVLGAQAASLYLIDRATDELVFEVALGESAAQARKFRVPVGQGIAGWVAQTGEAALIPDASRDPRFAVNIARSIGYIPKSVLCIPLRADEAVIGVVQLFDKASGAPFTAEDQALLEEFAVQAAVAIEQSRAVRDVCELFGVVLQGLVPDGDRAERATLAAHARGFAERTAASAQYRDAQRITELVTEISRQGPEGRHLCQALLNSVAEYTRDSGEPAGEAP